MPSVTEKHQTALWGEIQHPFTKFLQPDMLEFKAANKQQMYGNQFDVKNYDVSVDLCICKAQDEQVNPSVCDLKGLGQNCCFVNEEKIWQRLKNTTQFARAETCTPF